MTARDWLAVALCIIVVGVVVGMIAALPGQAFDAPKAPERALPAAAPAEPDMSDYLLEDVHDPPPMVREKPPELIGPPLIPPTPQELRVQAKGALKAGKELEKAVQRVQHRRRKPRLPREVRRQLLGP